MFATFPIATKMLKIFVLFAVMLNSLFHKINFHSFSFFRFSCRSIILLLLLLQKKKKNTYFFYNNNNNNVKTVNPFEKTVNNVIIYIIIPKQQSTINLITYIYIYVVDSSFSWIFFFFYLICLLIFETCNTFY